MTTVELWDPLSPEMLRDPYPRYASLRENHPIFYHQQMKSWVVSRYDDCREVLRNNDLFARDRRRIGEPLPEVRQNLQSLDPPHQTDLRSLLVVAFRAQDFDAVGAASRKYLADLLADRQPGEVFDWISEVAAPYALHVTALLHGVKPPELDYYAPLSEAVAHMMDSGLVPEHLEPGDKARTLLNQMAEQWYDDESSSDFLARVKADARQQRIPAHYLKNSVGLMFNASYGTVFAAVGNLLHLLVTRPGLLDAFTDDKLLATGADELLRFDGPAQGTSRVATRDTVIQGQTVRVGEIVLTLVAAANRDPRQFAHPEELVLDRSPNRHLAFGWGPHACIGAKFGQLAVMELIRVLVASPELQVVGDVPRRDTATVRSIVRLPVAFA